METNPGRRGRQVVLAAFCVLLTAGFTGLGVWQLQRLSWKTALIARVQGRVHATPTAAPAPPAWPRINREADEYRRVIVRGVYLKGRDTRVQAVTALGGGYWVVSPLRTDQGFTVLVNRGFVPPERESSPAHGARIPEGGQQIVGLLRISEPHGGFLRANDPATNRWRSRDVAAIAAAQGIADVAPYFIDAEAEPSSPPWPRAGLTVVSFSNSHLVYAVTWFAMALGALCAVGLVFRERRAHEDT